MTLPSHAHFLPCALERDPRVKVTWVKMVACVLPTTGSLMEANSGEANSGSLYVSHALPQKSQDPFPAGPLSRSEVPAELPEFGSHSRAPQMPLAAVKELSLGSRGQHRGRPWPHGVGEGMRREGEQE